MIFFPFGVILTVKIMKNFEYSPSGKLKTGWKPGSTNAMRSDSGIVSGKSRGAVGSDRPVHKAHGCRGQ